MKRKLGEIIRIRSEMITVMLWAASFLFMLLLLLAEKFFDLGDLKFRIIVFILVFLLTLLISFFHGIWFRNRILSLLRSLKETERKLSISEEKYKELFDSMDSGVAVYEVIDGGKDFIYKDFNKAAATIVSTTKEEVIGKSVFEIRPNIKDFGLIDVFQKVINTGKPEKIPATYYEDDTLSGWYEDYVYELPTKEIATVFRDVTESKVYEQKLLLRDNYLAALNKLKKIMLQANNSNTFHEILEVLAQLTNSSRTIIFRNSKNKSGELFMSQIEEFCQEGIEPQINKQFLQNIPYSDFKTLKKTLSEKNCFWNIEDILSKNIRTVLSSLGIKSILTVPINIDDGFWGFIAFEDCINNRKWNEIELEFLNIAANDISQFIVKKRIEKKIKEEHHRFKTILDSINAVVYVSDIKTKELLFINAYAKNEISVSDDVIGKKCYHVLQKNQNEPCMFCTDKHLIDNYGKPTGVYLWEFQNTVSKRWFSCRDIAIEWKKGRYARLEIATDITELRQTVKELRESEKSFKTIFDNAIDAIYIMNEHGKFIDVNPAVNKMYGFRKEEILGKTPALFSAPGRNNLELTAEYVRKAFYGEPQQFEFWGLRKNGEIFPKFVRLSNGYYFGKKVVNAFAIDLTEIKKAEDKLRSAKDRLSMANSILRHDITNDLTTISSAIKLFQKKTDPKMLEVISKRVKRSLHVIETHKHQEYFIENNSNLKKIDLMPIFDRLINIYDDIEINILGNACVYADTAIYSVFENLFSNSIKHGNANKIDVIIKKQNKFDIIKVCDNGIGIIDEIKNKVFEKGFFHGEHGHTGIGLHIVKRKINDYGGSISIEDNDKCQGACFVIHLKNADC